MVSQLAQIFEEAQLDPEVIHLEVGDLDFPLPGPIAQAAIEAINGGKTHYTSVAGTRELRRLAAQDFQQDGIKTANPENTIIGAGAKPLITLAIRVLLKGSGAGCNEFIILDPSYPSYKKAVLRNRGAINLVDTSKNRFYPDFDEIKKRVSPRTRAIIVNYPNNPTGVSGAFCSLQRLAELPANVWILLDEAYCQLVYGSGVYLSPAALPEIAKRAIVIRSCSKTYAMSGLRIGYLTASQEIIDQITDLLSDELGCPCSISQEAAKVALSNGRAIEGFSRLETRRAIFCSWLNNHAISYPNPNGAFYVFANFSQWGTSKEITEKLLSRAKVAIAPGTAFGNYEGWLRFSYASVDTEQLREALSRIEKVLFQ